MLEKDPCGNCGSKTYSKWRKHYPEEKPAWEECDMCGSFKGPKTYDDIYKGDCNSGVTTDPNLCDPATGRAIPYSSAGEKKAIMDRLQVKQNQSAERHHGARNESHLGTKKYI